MNQLAEVLMERLENKGLQAVAIPLFLRDVINTISDDPQSDLPEMNRQLHLLGWEPIELDDHTLQLIIAGFEADGVLGDEIKRS